MSDWQPIESAPKDGTEILLGLWRNGSWLHIQSDFWRCKFWAAWAAYDFNPTHWASLPSPPKDQT